MPNLHRKYYDVILKRWHNCLCLFLKDLRIQYLIYNSIHSFIYLFIHSFKCTFMWKTNIICVLGQCSCSRWRYSRCCVKATQGPLGRFTTGGCKGLNTHSALYFSLGLALMSCSNQAKWPRKNVFIFFYLCWHLSLLLWWELFIWWRGFETTQQSCTCVAAYCTSQPLQG